jgi:hypothetical protein
MRTETSDSKLPTSFGLWRECPEDASVAWGARTISVEDGSFDVVFDRQSWHGPEELRKEFSRVLNAGPIEWAQEECQRLKAGFLPHTLDPTDFKMFARRLYHDISKKDSGFPRPPHSQRGLHPNNQDPKIAPYVQPVPQRMRDDEAEAFTLYSDGRLTIRANTNASFGYVYIVAFPTHQAVDVNAVRPMSECKDNPGPGDVFWSGAMDVPKVGDIVRGPEWICDDAIALGYKVEHGFLGIVTCPLEPSKEWIKQRDVSKDSRLCFMFGADLREKR